MAEIRKIIPRPALSDFSRVAPSGGMAFKLLADAADIAVERLKPYATKKLSDEKAAEWRAYAKGQMGSPSGEPYSGGGSPFRAALRASESGGNASVVNSEGYTGLYQWGPARLADYNRATGQNLTMEQFKGDAGIQEAAQDWHEADILSQLGGYVGTTVNGIVLDEGAILGMAHLGGVGGAKKFIETGGSYDPADSNGTSLSDYARKFSGKTTSTATEPTMIRTKDGALEPRMFSPLSDPMMQAANAAGGVAYLSEAMLRGTTDLMGMSSEFELNPDGFRQAAESYISQIVDSAPEPFREDLRGELTQEAQRRFLGMVEDKDRDTRQRAANSTEALSKRWASDYASAIATGDPKEIALSEERLRSVLRTRESLPGLSWTPEQSENVVLAAREDAKALVKARTVAKKKADGADFDVAVSAAKGGMIGAAEGRLLDDPAYAVAYPDRVAELRAWAQFRDLAPTFDGMSLDEQSDMVARAMAANPTTKHEVEITKALAARATANRKARNAEVRVGNTMAELRDASVEWNPYDAKQRKRVDEAYEAMLGDNAPLSEAGQATAADIAARTGFVPGVMVDAIRSTLHSGDPAALASAMEFAGQVIRSFPNAFGSQDGGREIEDALSDYRFYGRYMDAASAAATMAAADLPENVERRERMAATMTAKAKLLTPTDITEHFESRGQTVELPPGDVEDAVLGEYRQLFEAAFINTGNSDLAKQRALDSLSKVYGPSGINGSETLMRYPPVSFYPARDGSHDWMRDQLERDVTALATGDDMDEGTRNMLGFVRSGAIGADRIMLVSDAGTQDDVAAGRAPSYTVQYLDDEGVIQLVPGRYRFEPPAQASMDAAQFNNERTRLTAESNILAWREHFVQDPNRTKTISEIDAMLAANRDQYMAAPPETK